MKRLLSRTFVIAMVSVLFSAFGTGASPAGATAVGGAELLGSVSPDPFTAKAECVINTTDPECTFSVTVGMSGNAAGVVTIGGVPAPVTCAITYNSTGTTSFAAGSGTGNLTCNGTAVTAGGLVPIGTGCSNVGYSQTGGLIVVTGTCTGDAAGALTAVCGIQVVPVVGVITAECAFTIL